MGEGKRKTSLSVNELLFHSHSLSAPFFRKNPKNQLYCLVIEYIESLLDKEMLYNGFINGVFSRTRDPNFLYWNLSEPGIKLTKRAVDHFQNNEIFLFINAQLGIDIHGVRDKVYSINMRQIDLKSEYPKPIYTSRRQAFL